MSSANTSIRRWALSNRAQPMGMLLATNVRARRSKLLITMQRGDAIYVPEATKDTSVAQKTTSLPIGTPEKNFRTKQSTGKGAPKLLSKVQELRLLSKLEAAGLLSQLERSGVTLAKIEKAGLLTTAEKFGLLSAASNRQTPTTLFAVAFALFVVGPAAVYLIPDQSSALIAAQVAIASVGALGGAAAFGGATLLSTLQK